MLRVARYGKTRFWALWDGNDLVAVVVYKKGAAELLRRLAAQAPAVAEAAAQAAAVEAAARQAQELAADAASPASWAAPPRAPPGQAGRPAATNGSATAARRLLAQPSFSARRQELGQQRGGRGQGWRAGEPPGAQRRAWP